MTKSVDMLSAQLKLADDLFHQKIRPLYDGYLKTIVSQHQTFFGGFESIYA